MSKIIITYKELNTLSKLETKEEILEYLNKKKDVNDKNISDALIRGEKNKEKRIRRANKFSVILKHKAEEFREKLIKAQTESEKIMKILLKEKGIKYDFQKIFYVNNKFYILDFYINDANIAVELDGFHHFTPQGKKDDKERTRRLLEYGLTKVIRFANSEITDSSIGAREKVIRIIKSHIKPKSRFKKEVVNGGDQN